MKAFRSFGGRLSVCAVGITLLFPPAAAFAQCNMKQDPPLKISIGKPGSRLCCSLGYAQALDPDTIAVTTGTPLHNYGQEIEVSQAISRSTEPVGYIYTAGAGLVDIGHVRDNADLVFFVYVQLLDAQHAIYVPEGEVAVPTIPTDPEQLLKLTASIVFVNSWAHELTTWGDNNMSVTEKNEDFSAFSPEDLSSNIVGIEIAMRAIRASGPYPLAFNKQMDVQIKAMMTELKAQKEAVTDSLLSQVDFKPGDTDLTHKWYMWDSSSPGNTFVRILRRNFDGAAWQMAGAAIGPIAPWLNTSRFSDFYQQFLYVISDTTFMDATQVPETSVFALGKGGFLQWTTMPPGSVAKAAMPVTGLGEGICVAAPGNKLLTYGQLGTAKVNVYPGTTNQMSNMQDATNGIHAAFVKANPGMDKP